MWGTTGRRTWDVRDESTWNTIIGRIRAKRRTNAFGTCGTKVRGIRESDESDEKGTTGPGELGTCGTKSSDGPEKNRLR
ncbi:hypothetical protein KI387_022020, partial [Taxus chinensis]